MKKSIWILLFFLALKTAYSQQSAFMCSDTAYLFQGSPTEVYGIDLLTGSSTLLHSPLIPGSVNTEINATGFNRTDNHIWGVRRNTNQLVRISPDFSVTFFPINGLPPNAWFNTGDITNNGIMHIYSKSLSAFYQVDINPISPSYLQLLSALPVVNSTISDWAFNSIDGHFYTVSTSLELLRFNQSGSRTVVGPVTGAGIQQSAGSFGAVFMDALGQLFLSDNSSGQIYIVPQPHLGNTVAYLFSQGPISAFNDGAMCSATIISTSIPVSSLHGNSPTCYGNASGSVHATVSGGLPPYQYQWSNGVSGVNFQTGLTAGTYTVSVTDAAGHVLIDSISLVDPPAMTVANQNTSPSCFGLNNGRIQLTVSGGTTPYTVSWSGSNQIGLQASGLGAGQYSYTVTDQIGCTATGSTTLVQPPPLQINAWGVPDTVCQGDSVHLTASGTSQYHWSMGFTGSSNYFTPVVSGYYRVVGTDNAGCTGSDSVFVTVLESPNPTVLSDSLCLGDTFQPTCSYSVGAGQSITATVWDFGDGHQAIGVDPSHLYSQSGSYDVRVDVTTNTGCVGSGTGSVYVRALPQAIVSIDAAEGCSPFTVTFSNQSSSFGDPITQVRWLPWGVVGSSTFTHTYSLAGTYSVGLEVQTRAGCIDDTMMLNLITVHPSATAGFSFVQQPLSEYEPRVEIKDESLNASAWQWIFSDGFTSTTPEPNHLLPEAGSYTIVQIVTAPHGCNDTLTKEIHVLPEQSIWIPNAFSPNGDNMNDEFRAAGRTILEFELVVVDRWGQIVFKTTDLSKGWDGRFRNQDAPDGVYSYVIIYSDLKTRKQRLSGTVTLVR